ncbi:rRNA maturation RNase YbeY [Mobiluncus mulieris]|uniref:Endoribonuclease YbeY n=2 Tax=Mobiluncus mulieris TaxID=2052 RepID=E0QPU8_9ACTO|nr:rRNA maturation RNase YbeY [Mobiluncus mulieris]EEJ54708.1 translation metalloprotein YbeY [Mobiluncus mulieris ATCC 35243]EEZ91561.1 translation metalloprotein YbeY [Mobiluncus mulieris 28-1]EFM46328.1 translation metalloprotein YbeY [Mobiluncus mulieris ATCC 35239]MBB5846699.1 putative rRNA maturation factor [Mobiluncus mulieris]MCU9968332.1 rRNA maturation RNase YbeY [Mobiluncus mulieris]
MSVEVNNETEWDLDATEFVALISFCLEQLYVSPAAEVNLMMVDMATMTDLHIRWMDLPGPTDVLSFPMDELTPGQEGQPSAGGMLGDIVLCPDVAAEQARDAGHSAVEEMLLLTVHGLLHLLGFDHVTEEEEKTMFTLQRRLLLSFLAQR